MTQERKLVTVLYADIVGSTALTERHDAEVVRETLDEAFQLLERVLVTHGATVEKFIGDAVMAIFGVPAAHDDDADRGVRAAVACRDAIASFDARHDVRLELRIGVNTGEAVAGGRASERVLATGGPVIAGARLQQAALPGEILVGQLTKSLTQSSVTYALARPIEAKGIGRIEAWPVVSLVSAIPGVQVRTGRVRAPFIGRAREMRTLREMLESTMTSDPSAARLVTIYGPAGSGKTRLADEFAGSLRAVTVLRGRCLPYGEAITFYPLLGVIRGAAHIQPDDGRDRAVAKLQTTVADIFGDASEATPVLARITVIAGLAKANDVLREVDVRSIADELRWGLRLFLERHARSRATVVFLEDIHWAEPALLEAVEYVVARVRAPLLVVCLARLELRAAHADWAVNLATASEFELDPLSPDETSELIVALTSTEAASHDMRNVVMSRAQGNPLYVEELLHWSAAGGLSSEVVPPSLRGLITARLDRLSEPLKQLVQLASLPGSLFSAAALAALGQGTAPSQDLLDEAVRADLLIESEERVIGGGRSFRLKHVLMRDVAYATLSKADRSRLHDRYGRWLEDALGDRSAELLDVVAFHAEQADLLAHEVGVRDAQTLGQRAFRALRDAGRNAERRGDVRAAHSLFVRARAAGLRIDAPARDRAEVDGFVAILSDEMDGSDSSRRALTAALDSARLAGPSEVLVYLLTSASRTTGAAFDPRTRLLGEEAVAVARALGDPELVAEAALIAANGAGTTEERHQLLTQSYAEQLAAGARRSLVPTLARLGQSCANLGMFSDGFRHREEALRLARASRSPMRIADALWHLAAGLAHTGDVRRALRLGEEAMRIADDLAIPRYMSSGHFFLGVIEAEEGGNLRARRELEEAIQRADALGNAFIRDQAIWWLVRACLHDGDIDSAELLVQRRPAEQSSPIPILRALRTVTSAEIAGARRRPEADGLYRDAVEQFQRLGDGIYTAQARRSYAQFLVACRRGRDARPHIEWLLRHYADPAAARRRVEAEELLRQCEALSGC